MPLLNAYAPKVKWCLEMFSWGQCKKHAGFSQFAAQKKLPLMGKGDGEILS